MFSRAHYKLYAQNWADVDRRDIRHSPGPEQRKHAETVLIKPQIV